MAAAYRREHEPFKVIESNKGMLSYDKEAVMSAMKKTLGGQMSRATPQMRNLAERLIAVEAGGKRLAATRTPARFDVGEKLRLNLATLMGKAGFCALLARALALAQAEVPWLGAVHVKADGSLDGVEKPHVQLDPNEFFEGRVVLLAQLLGLLVAFIGEKLTLRLMRDVWPNVKLDDLDFGNGDKK
jgi:hypothetical protein